MRNNNGFMLMDFLIALGLAGALLTIAVNFVDFSSISADRTKSSLLSSFTYIESAALNYQNEKGAMPTSLTDNTFVPIYLHPPKAPTGFDGSYGVDGFNMALRTGQASPDNGYYVCAVVSVTDASDPRFVGIKRLSESLSSSKYFYSTACPATTNIADPAGAATVYATYWLTRY